MRLASWSHFCSNIERPNISVELYLLPEHYAKSGLYCFNRTDKGCSIFAKMLVDPDGLDPLSLQDKQANSYCTLFMRDEYKYLQTGNIRLQSGLRATLKWLLDQFGEDVESCDSDWSLQHVCVSHQQSQCLATLLTCPLLQASSNLLTNCISPHRSARWVETCLLKRYIRSG